MLSESLNQKSEKISFYELPLEEQRRRLEEEYSTPEAIEELKRIARGKSPKGKFKIRTYSPAQIEEARYKLLVLGEGWEVPEDLKSEKEVEIEKERIKELLEEKKEDLEMEIIKAGEEGVISEDIKELRDLYQLGKWKDFLKKKNWEKELSKLEELTKRGFEIAGMKDEEEKGKAEIKYRKEKKGFINKLIGQCDRSLLAKIEEIEKFEDDKEGLRKQKEKLEIERIKNFQRGGLIFGKYGFSERQKRFYEEVGRIDLAYGDDPSKLMERVRKAGERGEDITRWRAEVWKNKYVVMAMTYPHILTVPRLSMEASWYLKDTLKENPEFFSPGIEKEPDWPTLEEKGEPYSVYPTWAKIPGLINKIVLSALEVDPVPHIEDLYKNARLADQADLQRVIQDCLVKKIKPEDIIGFDGGCFELKVKKRYKEKYQFDKKTGRLKDKVTEEEYDYDPLRNVFLDKEGKELDKTLEEIIDTTSTFWLITRYMHPFQVGGPEIVRSVYTSGKPETQASLIANKNYFIDKSTRGRIEKMEEYLSKKEKFSPQENIIIQRELEVLDYILKSEEAWKTYEGWLNEKLEKFYGIVNPESLSRERKILELKIRPYMKKEKIGREEAILRRSQEIEREKQAVENIKSYLKAKGIDVEKDRKVIENSLKSREIKNIDGFKLPHVDPNTLILEWVRSVERLKNRDEVIKKYE